MEIFARVTQVGELVEHEWKNGNGELKTISSVEVTLSDGIDQYKAEATDTLAKNIASNGLDENGLYKVSLRFSLRENKEKTLVFQSIRLLVIEQL